MSGKKRRAVCRCLILCALLVGCTADPPAIAQPEPDETPEPVTEQVVAIDTVEEAVTPLATPSPSPTPMPSPTPTPTPSPTPEPEIVDEQRLESGEFDPYFDDAVFVGDSITKSFGNYVNAKRADAEGFLGTAQFLGVVNMTAGNASADKIQSNGINFRYRGRQVTFSQAIEAVGAKKVFILLGANELEYRKWDSETACFRKMFELIRSVQPDAEIVVTALLPVTARYAKSHQIDIAHWNGFNDVLRETCENSEVTFFSFAEALMDENGYLRTDYSSDGSYHLNKTGCDIWIRALRRFAAERQIPDAVFDLP